VQYLYGAFALVLAIAAFYAAVSSFRLRRRVRRWPSVRGHVTMRQTIQPTDRGRMSAPAFRWAADVRYAYSVDGVVYEGDKTTLPWSATGSKKSAEKELERIPDETDVLYDPADPKTSCLYPPGRMSIAVFAVGGVLVLLLGLAYVA
jgi:hypothetical protein